MKTQMRTWKNVLLLISLGIMTCFTACNKDDETPQEVPTITTANITDITTTSAVGGGTIVDNGNVVITASGLVYSNVVSTPSLADSKTVSGVTSGSFTSLMDNLTSGSTYYVRAYATNSIGTGYGDIVQFNTDNAAPIATNVIITGDIEANKEATASYTYSDVENDTESGTTFQWYIADDASGINGTAITGATTQTYTIDVAYEDKFISVGVTPIASSGNTNGEETKSAYFEIGAATTVTFTYNNEEVTYGIITSATTGKKWLDRNLGAANVPTTEGDFANYGDLFQWGRFADGHQVISRTGPNNEDATGVNGTTTTLSTSDNPGHSQFIVAPSSGTSGADFDWRKPQNHNLWQVAASNSNNPCPTGWHVPTKVEWAAENITSVTDGFTKMNLTLTGYRSGTSGNLLGATSGGFYWSSNNDALDPLGAATYSTRIRFNASSYNELGTVRSGGYAVRCIKN